MGSIIFHQECQCPGPPVLDVLDLRVLAQGFEHDAQTPGRNDGPLHHHPRYAYKHTHIKKRRHLKNTSPLLRPSVIDSAGRTDSLF